MAERYQDRNWDLSNREKENLNEEYQRYLGHRPAWRPAYYGISGYGATLASEIPFYGTEQFAPNQVLQQPYQPAIHQPFPGTVPQQFTPNIQQPFLHQQYPYAVPLQQPLIGLQQQVPMPMQQPLNPQAQMQQPYAFGIPQQQGFQQQYPQVLQQPFPQTLQQHFMPQPSPYAQIPQSPMGFPFPQLGFPLGFAQSPQQSFGQQIQGQQPLQRGRFSGRGPKNYRRPDERIREDAMERLTTHPDIDAINIDITVKNGEITLKGAVEDRLQKRIVEDLVETVFGCIDVQNQLRVEQTQWNQFSQNMEREEFTSKGKEK